MKEHKRKEHKLKAFSKFRLHYEGTLFGCAKTYKYDGTSIVVTVDSEGAAPVRIISFSTRIGTPELTEDVKREILYNLGMTPDKEIEHWTVGHIGGRTGDTQYYSQAV